MPRPPRVQYQGAIYHVMNRGAARRVTFSDDDDRRLFIALLGDMADRHKAEPIAYCLMPNHYHLVVRTPDGNLDAAMHRFAAMYVRRFNRRHGRDGPLFRGRYRAILVDSEEYLLQVVRYVHRNPLGTSDAPNGLDRFGWSSHPSYIGARATPRWLETDLVLGLFGRDRRRYEQFVMRPHPSDHRPATSADSRSLLRASLPSSPMRTSGAFTDIDAAVATACGVPVDTLTTGARGATNHSRGIAMLMARALGHDDRAIAAHYGLGGPSSVRSVVSRLDRRVAIDDELRRWLDHARRLHARAASRSTSQDAA